MDRLINENAVLSAIGEWIAHNEHTYTNATEYLRNRVKAIKTAEQEPTAKENLVVGDCISRKAVLDALNKWDWQELYLPVHFKDIIDDLPSIQPKPKTECSCEQIKWERDIAIEQLHELGYELGQKIEPCEDCISRKAVIDGIDNYIEKAQSTGAKDDFISFEELVVKALPSIQPTAKENLVVEDCISRKQAMKACYQMAVRTGIEEMPYKYVETELAHLPSIQPKTGHWISKHIVDDCNGVVTWYECSECGRSVDETVTEEFMLKDYPYCHCGARMLPTDSEKER